MALPGGTPFSPYTPPSSFSFHAQGGYDFSPRSRIFFFPGLDGLPLPTTPSTKKARAGQLNKKDQIAESLKVPVLINAAHLRRGIRGAMRDRPTSTYAHCS